MLALPLDPRGVNETMTQNWALKLFRKSVPKQNKFRQITEFLGNTRGMSCLDVGSDNGAISYLLRQRGGSWKSADLDEAAVCAIRELVREDVYQIDGQRTPFADSEFDRIVIVDFLEHIETDRVFIRELSRILKPGGQLIINVPHAKRSLLRQFRQAIGQTDETHGHVRAGYTIDDTRVLLNDMFTILSFRYYSKFFTELIDTLIRGVLDWYRGGSIALRRGRLVVEQDLRNYRKAFTFYSLVYPLLWSVARLDEVLFWCDGYVLIIKAVSNKK